MKNKFFDSLMRLDGQLAAKNFPRFSPFWKDTLKRFYAGSQRRCTLRVGRRGGKSSTMTKVALAVALFGDWTIPAGDVGIIAFVSVDRGEAAARLRTIGKMLDALDVKYTRRTEEIELAERGVIFRVLTASSSGVVGITCLSVFCDEVSRWRDTETSANPAAEIVASLSPTMATIPSARMFLCSSPWSTTDFHASAFDAGDSELQMTAWAPTWIGNPSITEAQTRRDEPDEKVHAREYGANATDSVSSVCTSEELAACISHGVTKREPVRGGTYFHTLDPAFKSDAFVIGTFHREMQERSADLVDVLVLDRISILKPSFIRKIKLEDAIAEIATHVRAYGGGTCYSDSHYAEALSPQLSARGIQFVELKNSSSLISARIGGLQTRLGSGRISLLDVPQVRTEILQAQLLMRSGGQMILKAPERRGFHDDCVSMLMLACEQDVIGKLPMTESRIVVEYGRPHWDHESKTLSGCAARYYERQGSRLVPRSPPYGTLEFEAYAQTAREQGFSTRALEIYWSEQNQKGGNEQ